MSAIKPVQDRPGVHSHGRGVFPFKSDRLSSGCCRLALTSRWCLRVVWLFVLALQAPAVHAQSGTTGAVEGRILDVASGNYLRNVMVSIEGTNLQTTTNADGEYRFSNVPVGPVLLRASYPGYRQQTASLTVTAGRPIREDIEFIRDTERGDVVMLDAFSVQEQQLSAEAAALLEQRQAANIKNVVALEEIGDIGVNTPGAYLVYLPGVAANNTTGEIGQVWVRGMPPGGTLVTVDGMLAASNDPASRAFDFFGSVTTNNVVQMEVSKVPTPDMPANAVGGSINLIEKSARSRKTPLLQYNVFGTFMAKESPENVAVGLNKRAGFDPKSSIRPLQPGFDLSYFWPINDSLALVFTAAHNARLQDREYYSVTWNRVASLQTGHVFNSIVNIFRSDSASLNLDARVGHGTIRVGVSYTDVAADVGQHNFTPAFGAGATGGEDFTQGAATGVGSVAMSSSTGNQGRASFKTNVIYRYEVDGWKLDAGVIRTQATRTTVTIDDGMFTSFTANIPNLVLGATGLSGIHTMTLPRYTAQNRAGAPVNIYNIEEYTLTAATSTRIDFENVDTTGMVNLTRAFNTEVPLSLKTGGLVNTVRRDDLRDNRSWSFTPPNATTGGRLVGNYDLVNEGYSNRRTFKDNVNFRYMSTYKLYQLYEQHPDWFVENEATRHTNRVNNSKKINETISAAYVRGDVKLLNSRLWLVGGVRFERTETEGWGPVNDITATYQKDANGQILRNPNGTPILITTNALEQARLRYVERGQYVKSSYGDYYPSLNTSYMLRDNLILRAAYARTIGRPDLSFLIPTATIPDPEGASRNITVSSRGLEPWTANNYDFTVETYEMKGASLSVALFRKEISNFFFRTITPLTPELVNLYNLPPDLLEVGDFNLNTWVNSPDDAVISGIEWSWRQKFNELKALPGWLRGTSFFVNGSHQRVTGPGGANFAGWTPKIINWGLTCRLGKFTGTVRATNSAGTRGAAVATSATAPAGTYQGQASRTIVSTSLNYQLSRRLLVQLNVQNLTNSYFRNMTYAPGAPAYTQPTQFRDLGIEYTLGIRGSF